MWIVFFILLLLAPIALVTGLIKPRVFARVFKREFNRKQLSGIFSGIFIASFVLFGIAAPDTAAVPAEAPERQEEPIQASVEEAQSSLLYSVVKVVDGDTFDVAIDGKPERVRLVGVDTPEVVDPRRPVECFGQEASRKAKELLEGKKVRLEVDSSQGDRDKYDRLLRYAFLEDGSHMNKIMISEGYAHEYTHASPYRHQQEFKQAEIEARNAKRGLWADGACGAVSLPPTPSAQPVQQNASVPAPVPTAAPALSADKDCPDFRTQAEAQAFFEAQGGPARDPHRLDGDHDGVVCENIR